MAEDYQSWATHWQATPLLHTPINVAVLKAACRCRSLTTEAQHMMCRDANLRRSKIWRLSILHYTPLPCPQMTTAPLPPPPAHKLTQPPWLKTLCEVLHEVHAIKICLHHYNDEIIFAGD